jgi:hypothetical protein
MNLDDETPEEVRDVPDGPEPATTGQPPDPPAA